MIDDWKTLCPAPLPTRLPSGCGYLLIKTFASFTVDCHAGSSTLNVSIKPAVLAESYWLTIVYGVCVVCSRALVGSVVSNAVAFGW